MQAIQQLNDIGQSIWLDRLDRDMLDSGRFEQALDTLSVAGATTNPGALARTIREGFDYNASIHAATMMRQEPEDVFYGFILEDLTRASALLQPLHERSDGEEGWVTLPVSPKLREASRHMVAQALRLHAEAGLPNLAVELPGTRAGLKAAEDTLAAGVPVVVTHVFSPAQYRAAADACMRGLERRVSAGREQLVPCFVSVNVRAWDEAVEGRVPRSLRGELGLAIARRVYRAFCRDMDSIRADRLAEEAALPPQLVWASTSGTTPQASDVTYVEELAARDTVCVMSETTLNTFARHGRVHALLPRDGGNAHEVLAEFERAGVDVASLADALQREALLASRQAWLDMLTAVDTRGDQLHMSHGDICI